MTLSSGGAWERGRGVNQSYTSWDKCLSQNHDASLSSGGGCSSWWWRRGYGDGPVVEVVEMRWQRLGRWKSHHQTRNNNLHELATLTRYFVFNYDYGLIMFRYFANTELETIWHKLFVVFLLQRFSSVWIKKGIYEHCKEKVWVNLPRQSSCKILLILAPDDLSSDC